MRTKRDALCLDSSVVIEIFPKLQRIGGAHSSTRLKARGTTISYDTLTYISAISP